MPRIAQGKPSRVYLTGPAAHCSGLPGQVRGFFPRCWCLVIVVGSALTAPADSGRTARPREAFTLGSLVDFHLPACPPTNNPAANHSLSSHPLPFSSPFSLFVLFLRAVAVVRDSPLPVFTRLPATRWAYREFAPPPPPPRLLLPLAPVAHSRACAVSLLALLFFHY